MNILHATFPEDFPINVAIIWNQWKTRKMTDEDAERDLVMCRDKGAPSALQSLDQIRKRQKFIDSAEEDAHTENARRAQHSVP